MFGEREGKMVSSKTVYSEGRCKRDVKGREQDRRRTDSRE